jgi:predicted AAA+ superfamily ATPase
MFKRSLLTTLLSRLQEQRRFIQVLAGPRQVGKTTLAHQAIDAFSGPTHYASADEPTLQGQLWIEQQWDIARLSGQGGTGALLILDEVQKLPGWSEVVKRLWDEDSRDQTPLKVVLLGSAPLLVQHGLSESLAGRFEIIPVPHWSFQEMQLAFGWNVEQFIYFGGYPGAAPLISDEKRWARYIIDSLIETTISRDVLLMSRVDKPALLRRLFQLGCIYSSQVLSYQKMMGQLQDAGNTTTLAHYLELLTGAGMLTGLPKFAGQKVRQRASSPKFQALNTALISAQIGRTFAQVRQDHDLWGRLVESAIGAHLLNSTQDARIDIFYWRERDKEVDFVLAAGEQLTALEVKSSGHKERLPGLEAFAKSFNVQRKLLIGGRGIPLDEFLSAPAAHWA